MTAAVTVMAALCFGLVVIDPGASGAQASTSDGSVVFDADEGVHPIVAGGDVLTAQVSAEGGWVGLEAQLEAGDYGLRVDEASGPTGVEVDADDGEQLVYDDDTSLDRVVSFTVPESGSYWISVDPRGATGSWRLELEQLDHVRRLGGEVHRRRGRPQ